MSGLPMTLIKLSRAIETADKFLVGAGVLPFLRTHGGRNQLKAAWQPYEAPLGLDNQGLDGLNHRKKVLEIYVLWPPGDSIIFELQKKCG